MALSANKFNNYKPSSSLLTGRRSFEVLTGVRIFKGALVTTTSGGYLTLATDTASTVFAGVALEEADNRTGASGAIKCLVDVGGAEVLCDHEDSITIANVGDAVVQEEDDHVTSAGTGTNDIPVGVITQVVTTGSGTSTCWVKLRPFGTVS